MQIFILKSSYFEEDWVNYFKLHKKMLIDLQNYGADLSKIPTKKSQESKVGATGSSDSSGLSGTFRKLNVD